VSHKLANSTIGDRGRERMSERERGERELVTITAIGDTLHL